MPVSYGARTQDRRVILSAIWIVAMFNYLYTDLAMMIFHPAVYQKIASRMAPEVALGWTIFMETAMAMILLSRLLPYSVNRWANIVVGVLQTGGVCWTLAGGMPPLFYLFTATVEIGCTLLIIGYAWAWRPDAAALSASA